MVKKQLSENAAADSAASPSSGPAKVVESRSLLLSRMQRQFVDGDGPDGINKPPETYDALHSAHGRVTRAGNLRFAAGGSPEWRPQLRSGRRFRRRCEMPETLA